jgi:anti-sigma regulatory factor (Ser/Thr protein kinase)
MRVRDPAARVLTLPGEPRSVGDARAFVRRLLEDCGRPEWVDAAVLAVSELFTNAVLHAHSAQIELSAAVEDEHVQVGVRDLSPVVPSQRSYDDYATTGRGLGLVAALSVAHGVESLGAEGKVVWFRVGDGPERDEAGVEDLLDQWDEPDDVAAPLPAAVHAPDVVDVELRSMPATLWLAAREHHDALLRELVLLQAWPGGAAGIGDLAAADAARMTIGAALDAAVQQARDRGAATVPCRSTTRARCRPSRRRSTWSCRSPATRRRPSPSCRTCWTTASGWPPPASCWPAAACRRSSRCATGRPSRSSPSSPARRRRRGREPTTSGSPPTSTAAPCRPAGTARRSTTPTWA